MLDEQDLKAISEMLAQQKTELEAMMDQKISESENRMMTFYENRIQPQFDLLAEGHQLIMETMTPKTKTEELEEEIVFLKSVVGSLARRVSDLEAAQ